MTKEKWLDIKSLVDENFGIADQGQGALPEEQGPGELEYIEFKGPMGKMRLEFITRPLVLDKKTQYSRRIGSETKVEYVYSETEKTYTFNAYKWDEATGEWEEIDKNDLGLIK